MWRETDGLTLGDALLALEQKGFVGSFHAEPSGDVKCEACGKATPASALSVLAQARVEGVSDPADESLLAGLRCPACGARGALILAYGPRAGRGDSSVLAGLSVAGGPGTLRRA